MSLLAMQPRKLLVASVVASIVSAAALATDGDARTSAPRSSNGDVCTEIESVERVAANIERAGGRPTDLGRAFASAAASRDLTGVRARLQSVKRTAQSNWATVMLATNANPAVAAGGSDSRQAPTAPKSRALASVRRALGSTMVDFNCGGGMEAHVIWYCVQGSSNCRAAIYRGLTSPQYSSGGGCSVVNRYPCQMYSYSWDTYAPDFVDYVTLTQVGMPGPPAVGDKWCTWT
jgi:hypothetical protein